MSNEPVAPHVDGQHDPAVVVRFLGYPLKLGVLASEHYNDVFREFALMATDQEQGDDVPGRLMALIDALGRRYAPQEDQAAERDAALARGETQRDISITVPVSAGGASATLDQMLDETDDFCRDGQLLTLAAPRHIAAFRRWYLQEVVRQTQGHQPTPWSDVVP